MPTPRKTSTILFIIAVLALGASTGPAHAAAGWVPLGTVTPPGAAADSAQTAIDQNNNITVVWESTGDEVFASMRPSGGTFSAPQSLGAGTRPTLGVSAGGEAIATWRGSGGEVTYAIRGAGASAFASPQEIAGSNVTGPLQSAVGPQGQALAVWEDADFEYSFRSAGGAFSAPDTVPGTNTANEFSLAMSSNGSGFIAWEDNANLGGQFFQASGGLGPGVSDFASPDDAQDPVVGVDQSGNASVAWDNEASDDVNVVRIQSNGSLGAIKPLTGSAVEPTAINITTTAAGSSHVVWSNASAGGVNKFVQARRITAGNSLGVLQSPLSASGANAFVDSAAGNPDGAVLAIWEAPGVQQEQGIAAPDAQPFGPAATLGSTSAAGDANGFVDINDGGNGSATWLTQASQSPVAVSGYDSSDPTLGVNIPSTGTQLKSSSFAATPFDAFALSGPVSWNFGDGKTGSGNSVSHTYAKPGTFTVTATASDTVGNSVSVKRTIKVASAPSAVGIISSKSLKLARNGRVSVSLRCAPAAWTTCRGTVYLRSAKKVRGASNSRARAKLLAIGQRSYSIAQGKRATVKVAVKRKARSIIRRLKRVRTRVSVTGRTGAGKMTIKRKTLTLRR